MALDTLSPEEKTELDLLETRLKKRARVTRYVVLLLVAASLGLGAWLASGLASYTPPELTPLEKLLTRDFVDLQLEWFDAISATSQVNRRLAADRAEAFARRAEGFLDLSGKVAPQLREPLTKLLETMRRQDQITLLQSDTPSQALLPPTKEINAVLAGLEPRFVLDVESFEGLLDNQYLIGAMVVIYEHLATLRFRAEGEEKPVELLVVRRRDALPADGYQHGYTRNSDTDLAFVLQDNATAMAAEYVFPSFERPDAAFEKRFGSRVPDDLKNPYRMLLELVHLELREHAGTDGERFKAIAANVARRQQIFKRAAEAAEKHNIHLKLPDGLVWPRSFASRVLLENMELNKKGEKLLYDADRDALVQVARALDNEESDAALKAVAGAIARSVGFHEARHVLDLREGRQAGQCILDRVRIVDRDPEFLRSVELECRAYLTELIEAPETLRLTLLSLVNHLYARSGTAYFYTARTLLHPLAFDKDEANIPTGWEYVQELTIRLAAAEPPALAERARAFHAECFGPYVKLELVEEEIHREDAGGCSVSGW